MTTSGHILAITLPKILAHSQRVFQPAKIFHILGIYLAQISNAGYKVKIKCMLPEEPYLGSIYMISATLIKKPTRISILFYCV